MLAKNIVFIMPSCSNTSPGILKKNVQRVSALKNNGIDISGLFFTKDHLDVKPLNSNILKIGYQDIFPFQKFPLLWRLIPYYTSWKHIRVINNYVNKVLATSNNTYIYLRYPGASAFALQMLRNWKSRGIKFSIEMNGKEEAFYQKELQDNPNDLFAKYRLRCEQKYASKIMQCASLIVGVSQEITKYYANNNLNYTLSNGFDVQSVEALKKEVNEDKAIKFVLISGSPNYWNGSDRYIRAFKNYKGTKPIELHLIGSFNQNYLTDLPSYIINHGVLEKKQIDTIMETMHIGLGSSALHRVNLTEGNVLKVREYIARGLPTVIGYQDTDLSFGKPLNFVYHIAADESEINLDAIIQWASDLYFTNPDINLNIRNFAEDNLDYSKKMTAFLSFLRKNKLVDND